MDSSPQPDQKGERGSNQGRSQKIEWQRRCCDNRLEDVRLSACFIMKFLREARDNQLIVPQDIQLGMFDVPLIDVFMPAFLCPMIQTS